MHKFVVHVHIGTEVLETLHHRVTGLCFMIKVWLVTLTGSNNSRSTCNFSEMIKKCACRIFLAHNAVNSLMPSHPGPPTKNVRWLDSNSLSRRYVQQIKNEALMPTVHSLSLLTIHSLILLAIRHSGWEAS